MKGRVQLLGMYIFSQLAFQRLQKFTFSLALGKV